MKKIILFLLLLPGVLIAQSQLARKNDVRDSLNNRLGENWVTPQMYGISPIEGVSVSTQLNTAISNLTPGSIFYFPEGTYYIGTELTRIPDNVSIIMTNGAWLKRTSDAGDINIMTVGDSCYIQVNIDGNNGGLGTNALGIYSSPSNPASNVRIINSKFKDLRMGIRGDGAEYWQVKDNYISQAGQSAILFGSTKNSPVRYNLVSGNTIDSCGDVGVAFTQFEDDAEVSFNNVIGNFVKNTQLVTNGYALDIERGNTWGYLHHNNFIGNTIDQSDTNGIYLKGGIVLGEYNEYSEISGNVIKGDSTSIQRSQGIAVTNSRYCKISENLISDFDGHGIDLLNSSYSDVKDNQIIDCGADGAYAGISWRGIDTVRGVNIDGNTINYTSRWSGGNGIGVYVATDTVMCGISVTNNKIYNYQYYGYLVEGVSEHTIENVDFTNNVLFSSDNEGVPIRFQYVDTLSIFLNSMRRLTTKTITRNNCSEVVLANNSTTETNNVRSLTAVDTVSSVKSLVDIFTPSFVSSIGNWNYGVALRLGFAPLSVVGDNYSSRLISYNNSYNTLATRLRLQTHSSTTGVFNDGMLMDEYGDVTFANDVTISGVTNLLSLTLNRFDTPLRDNVSADSLITQTENLDTLLIPLNFTSITGTDVSGGFKTNRGLTVKRVDVVTRTSATSDDNADINIYWATNVQAGSPTTLWTADETIEDTTTGHAYTTFDDAEIEKNSWVWAQCNAKTGTVNQIWITVVARKKDD